MDQSTDNIELPELAEEFRQHVWKHAAIAAAVILVSLGIGVIGFRLSKHDLSWTDCYLSAAMLLGGMGPMDIGKLSRAGKIFEAS
jgi:hypothetical protein